MKVDVSLLKRLEELSYIGVDDAKKEGFISQISDILTFAENLNSVDLSDISLDNNNISSLREDNIVADKNTNGIILKNSNKSFDNFFIVDNII